MKTNKATKLKNEFKKLKEVVDKQCIEAGTFPGDFEELDTPEIRRFLVVQKELISMGYQDFLMDFLGL